jgi:hypothetical protein
MKIQKIPDKNKNGLFTIKMIGYDKRIKSFSEIFKILSKPIKVYRGGK